MPLTLARMLASDWEERQTRDELVGGVNAYLWKAGDEIEQNDLEYKDFVAKEVPGAHSTMKVRRNH